QIDESGSVASSFESHNVRITQAAGLAMHPWTGTPPPTNIMLLRQPASAPRVWTPAKVNLFLEVLARRSDGYHELATLMTAVSLYDTLEFKEEPSGATQLQCDHPSLSTGPD